MQIHTLIKLKFGTLKHGITGHLKTNFDGNPINIHEVITNYTHKLDQTFLSYLQGKLL